MNGNDGFKERRGAEGAEARWGGGGGGGGGGGRGGGVSGASETRAKWKSLASTCLVANKFDQVLDGIAKMAQATQEVRHPSESPGIWASG